MHSTNIFTQDHLEDPEDPAALEVLVFLDLLVDQENLEGLVSQDPLEPQEALVSLEELDPLDHLDQLEDLVNRLNMC